MLRFYGPQPPGSFPVLRPGGICPHCKKGTRFTPTSHPRTDVLRKDKIKVFVASYACELCLGPIPIEWNIMGWQDQNNPIVQCPRLIMPSVAPYDFEHVPELVRKEIMESLACLSIGAYNGFSAVCRRSIQAICTDLGTAATSKVKDQIKEMIRITGLDLEWEELAIQIMLSGHDGSHPHLPEVGADRATVLLSLMQDLTYQLYTRPGKVKTAAALRVKAIQGDGA